MPSRPPFVFQGPALLQNARAQLVALERAHLCTLANLAADAAIWTYSTRPMATAADFSAYLHDALADRDASTAWPFLVLDCSGPVPQPAGCTRYFSIVPEHARLEIGYTWLAPTFQGTGLNRAMKHLMLNYAFRHLGAERVELRADARNARSRAAMSALGATYEGLLRHHMLLPDGAWRDTVYYSYLHDEWPDIEARCFAAYANPPGGQ